jgi:hypothetical protein
MYDVVLASRGVEIEFGSDKIPDEKYLMVGLILFLGTVWSGFAGKSKTDMKGEIGISTNFLPGFSGGIVPHNARLAEAKSTPLQPHVGEPPRKKAFGHGFEIFLVEVIENREADCDSRTAGRFDGLWAN